MQCTYANASVRTADVGGGELVAVQVGEGVHSHGPGLASVVVAVDGAHVGLEDVAAVKGSDVKLRVSVGARTRGRPRRTEDY